MSDHLTIARGNLYVPCALHARWFDGVDAVILMRRESDLLILPVRHAAGGGYMLKMRNAAGDRAVAAADFFRKEGVEDASELVLDVEWDAELAGLKALKAFVM